ncbi:triacylglycerol lipase [Emericellopsis cladophorae]|uniref:Triacylglycerol lipase n=1 Tax=Emericellopsis cladophorae TaxID=2686198 RepID=A0A9P9Y0G8_9HYPO|nr:triacylglycerol lipase [Emericellopsis cladophorae]KAI6780840.1 triacylglycerol lipase [Emericellopsis cladophorae]
MSSQPPYPIHESILPKLDAQYRDFYNEHLVNKQQVHLQPVAVSRVGGTLIPGSGPLQEVASTVDYSLPRKESHGPEVKLRCFTPLGKKPEGGWPVCIYFHGGGWVLGNIDTENVIASHLCSRGKSVVVAVDYSLAPENPFPAAVEDAWEATLWLLNEGKEILSLNVEKLATGGSSAGANLAAVMCQRAVARGTKLFKLQLLSVPVTDNTADTTNNSTWKEYKHTPALPAPKMLWYRNHYLPNKEDWSNPEASPLLWEGDWAKLPPACLVIGELDVLRSEGEQFAESLEAAGVRTEVHLMKGQPHPFIAMDAVLQAGSRAITIFCEALYRVAYQ